MISLAHEFTVILHACQCVIPLNSMTANMRFLLSWANKRIKWGRLNDQRHWRAYDLNTYFSVVSDYECGRIGRNCLIQPCVLIPLHKPKAVLDWALNPGFAAASCCNPCMWVTLFSGRSLVLIQRLHTTCFLLHVCVVLCFLFTDHWGFLKSTQ